ncbi:MAG TPA: transcriptional regulator [Limnochordia bacterium]
MAQNGAFGNELVRIGEKLVNRSRIHRRVDEILSLRAEGASQQSVAECLGIDRAFISHLERLGEVKKGGRVAVIGFPVANTEELRAVAQARGVEWILLMNNRERWGFVADKSGAELFNGVMEIISELQGYDAVVFIGSDMRIRLAKSVLGADAVIGWELGPSPITEDRYVDPEALDRLLRGLRV